MLERFFGKKKTETDDGVEELRAKLARSEAALRRISELASPNGPPATKRSVSVKGVEKCGARILGVMGERHGEMFDTQALADGSGMSRKSSSFNLAMAHLKRNNLIVPHEQGGWMTQGPPAVVEAPTQRE